VVNNDVPKEEFSLMVLSNYTSIVPKAVESPFNFNSEKFDFSNCSCANIVAQNNSNDKVINCFMMNEL
jgi:hypothetical protein